MDGGETAKIKFTVRNEGKGEGQGINLVLDPSSLPNGVTLTPRTISLGTIAPGESKEIEAILTASEEVKEQDIVVNIKAKEANGFDSNTLTFQVSTRAFQPPELAIEKTVLREDGTGQSMGNGDGLLQKGEQAEMTVFVRNNGLGKAEEVGVSLESADSNIIIRQGPQNLEVIEPGDWKKAVLVFSINNRYSGPAKLPLKLKITERRPRYSKEAALDLALSRTIANNVAVNIKGQESQEVKKPKPLPGLFGLFAGMKEEAETIVDVDEVPIFAKSKKEDAYAVVIGVEKYRQNLPEVKYATRDAEIVKKYLESVLGFEEENIFLLLNEKAAFTDIKKYVESRLPKLVNNNKESEIFFFFAGHGVPCVKTKDAFILPYDGDPSSIEETGYPLKSLYESLAKLSAKKIIVALDCCFSGAGVMPPGSRPVSIKVKSIPLALDNMVVFSAASGDELSLTYEEKKHGLFTYFFLKGLKGEADINFDKKVTASELYEYILKNVDKLARRQGQFQTPKILPANEMLQKNDIIIR